MPKRNGFFDFTPDRDFDDDVDLEDYLQEEADLDDIMADEERRGKMDFDEDDDWQELVEDGSEYGVDPYDYDSPEEYLEDLKEAKSAAADDEDDFDDDENDEEMSWEEGIALGEKYGVNPDDYETRSAYLYAVSDAIQKYIETLDSDDTEDEDDEDSPVAEAKRQLEWVEESDSWKKDPEKRKLEIEKCHFIIDHHDDILAAKYCTLNSFRFGKAVVENFDLPQELIDDYDIENETFCTIITDIAEVDASLAISVWRWVLKEFLPYVHFHPDYEESLRGGPIDYFSNDFYPILVDAFEKYPDFCETIMGNPSQLHNNYGRMIALALKLGKIELAKKMVNLVMNTPIIMKVKLYTIEKTIENCWNSEELETMEALQTYILPIWKANPNITLQRKLPELEQNIADYIEGEEEYNEKYAYTRRNAWRMDVKDNPYNLDPTDFDTLEEYQAEVADILAEKKDGKESDYDWRKYCTPNTVGVLPENYETNAEYRAAVEKVYADRQKEEQKRREALKNDKTVHAFCKVALDDGGSPVYYAYGDIAVHLGDRVVVPYGADNKEKIGTVVSLGECYPVALPFPIEKMKKIILVINK